MPKKAKSAEPDYTPVRRGALYCSPACGNGCTWAEYQYAVKKAAALCKKLGKGWEPNVWENGRWHYSAGKGVCSVHASYTWTGPNYTRVFHGYTAYFNSDTQTLGEHATNPVEALNRALDAARERIKKMALDVSEVISKDMNARVPIEFTRGGPAHARKA